jgi:benzoyl-CoA reductase/2-hydroxyglutaryl-CoA dehydratase subunit BcrC/BadD/HgdB
MITIPRRLESINRFKEQGGTVAAVLPIHYPRALLRAFNILPVEVWGPPRIGSGRGAVHLQPYICSIAQNALSFLLNGGLDVTDLIVVPHACDSLQGFGSVLIDFIKPNQPVIPLYLPRERRESDVDFLTAEIHSVFDRLLEITGLTPSDNDLLVSVQREEAADDQLSKLYDNNLYLPLPDHILYRLIRSREYLPAERFMELASTALALLREETRKGIPVILSGIVPEPMEMFEVISELGAVVVGDDLASCGRRLYPPGKSEDPLQRMAERIIHAPPDPTRGNPISERMEHLLHLAKKTGAKGIIFYDVKFCEPELFDIPILRKELGEENIPSIMIEVDINDPLSQQFRTRMGAFLEMLQ